MGGWHHSRTECAQQAGRWPRSQEGSYQVEGAPGPWPAAAEGTGEISNPTPRSDDPQPANPAHRPPARQAHIPARAPSKALKPRFQLRGIYPFRRTILSVNGIWSRKMTTYTTHESRTTNPIRCAPHRPFFLAALFFSKSTQNQYGCGPLPHNQQLREHFPLHSYTEPVQILCRCAQFLCRRGLCYT